jgi:hypothetical protein
MKRDVSLCWGYHIIYPLNPSPFILENPIKSELPNKTGPFPVHWDADKGNVK